MRKRDRDRDRCSLHPLSKYLCGHQHTGMVLTFDQLPQAPELPGGNAVHHLLIKQPLEIVKTFSFIAFDVLIIIDE